MKLGSWRPGKNRNGAGELEPGGTGLVQHELMDADFRRICAVFSDGRCLIAEGYGTDAKLRTVLQRLKREGAVPRELEEEKGRLEEIAAHWEEAAPREVKDGSPAIAGRVHRLVKAAADAKASDIVFEIEGGACRVSVIVNDRRLPLGERLTDKEGEQLTGYLFHSKEEGTGQTSYQKNMFQGFSVRGAGTVKLPGQVTALRCQRGPHEPEGDHLIARIFYRDQITPGTTLQTLGFSAEDEAMFAELRSSLSGGVILGGSTGDGKSTTLAVNLTLQQKEHGGQLNLVTVEDPVEYEIPGAIQIPVPTTGAGEDRGEHFTKALMHFVRIHPGVGMVSEIRDGDAAREVLQFIATGHQVWTTIHVADANGILFRMLDMGIDPAEVSRPDLVKLLMKQTLIPLLCPDCCSDRPAEPLEAWLHERVSGIRRFRYRNPEGCESCQREGEAASVAWNGYAGQTAVCESIRPDAGYLRHVQARDAVSAREYWIEELGGVPIGERMWAVVAEGRCDLRDALRKGARSEQAAGMLEAMDARSAA